MKKLLTLGVLFLMLQSCVSLFLIPDKMVYNDTGQKIVNCMNQDEDYVHRQFGTPTKVKEYDNGIKMVYYEEWGHFYLEKVGNTQYYTDYRFIKFQLDPEGYVEDYATEGHILQYDANQPVKTATFWAEVIAYALIAGAIGLI